MCVVCFRVLYCVFFLNDTAPTEIYTYLHTLSLHDALPISASAESFRAWPLARPYVNDACGNTSFLILTRDACRLRLFSIAFHAPPRRSEEHTSELQSLMRSSYAVFCLKKKKTNYIIYSQQTL